MKKKLMLLALMILMPSLAFAGTFELKWTASVSTDVTGYTVHYGNATKTYTQQINVGKVTTTDITVADGNWCFAVTAFDAAGNRSPYSNEACSNMDTVAPAAPGGLEIVRK